MLDRFYVDLQLGGGQSATLNIPGITALTEPRSIAHYVIESLLDAGAHFSFPFQRYCSLDGKHDFEMGFDMGLAGSYHDRYIDDLKEYLLYLLSRDMSTLSPEEGMSLAIILGEICCGRLPELWNAWLQGHALPADTPFSPDHLIDEVLSLIDPPDRPPINYDVCHVFNEVFRRGAANEDASVEVLSLLLRRRPSFSNFVVSLFTWCREDSFAPAYFLVFSSDRTMEILERCGADPNHLRLYAMMSVREIPYWEELIRKGVDNLVLNLMLLNSAWKDPIDHVKYLVSKGANVNFHRGFTGPRRSGRTALACSALMGNTETTLFLLSKGADVLQEVVGISGRKYTISQLATRLDRPESRDLAKTLERIEWEERLRRGKAHGMSPSSLECTC